MSTIREFCYEWYNATSRRDWAGATAQDIISDFINIPDDARPNYDPIEVAAVMFDIIREDAVLNMTIGERIRTRLVENDMTQAAFAERMHTTTRTIERWCADDRAPGGPTLTLAAQVLGVSRKWLEDGVE